MFIPYELVWRKDGNILCGEDGIQARYLGNRFCRYGKNTLFESIFYAQNSSKSKYIHESCSCQSILANVRFFFVFDSMNLINRNCIRRSSGVNWSQGIQIDSRGGSKVPCIFKLGAIFLQANFYNVLLINEVGDFTFCLMSFDCD